MDNRPGASGNIGAEIAARAAPDGYTFLVSASPALVINPSLYRNLPYNAERDFTPVARGVVSPLVFASHPSVPAKTLPALVALAKREPGKLHVRLRGGGSALNLVVKMLEEAAGVRFLHVPYKGVGPAVRALLSGEIAFVASDSAPYCRIYGREEWWRWPLPSKRPSSRGRPPSPRPAIPSIQASASFMVVAPAGTPPAIVQRMSAEIARVMKSPAIRERLEDQGFIPKFDTPDEFAAGLKRERQMWGDVIRRNKITLRTSGQLRDIRGHSALALVLLGGRARAERSQVAPPAGLRMFLPRVEPVFSRGQLPDHGHPPCEVVPPSRPLFTAGLWIRVRLRRE